jgi:hypothetical protein
VQRHQIVDLPAELGPRIGDRLELIELPQRLLRRLAVAPEVGVLRPRFQALALPLLGGDVKDAPGSGESFAPAR